MERKNNNGCDICCAEPKTIILSCGCTACLSCILFFFKQNLENGVGLPEKCINGLHSFDGFDEDFLIQTGAVEGLVKKFQQASFESKMNFFVCNYCGEISAVRDPKCNKKCPKCNIVVCAFCKEKWNSSKMKAQNYYCSKECTYYTYCTFGHTTFQSRPQVIPFNQIPIPFFSLLFPSFPFFSFLFFSFLFFSLFPLFPPFSPFFPQPRRRTLPSPPGNNS